jgi:hypothetical protein
MSTWIRRRQGNTIVSDTTASAELRAVAREAILRQGEQEFTNRRMGRAGDQSFWASACRRSSAT